MALFPLSKQNEPTLPEGTYDVRGWEVRTRADDHHVGTVHDMLLDGDGWPRYLDVKAEGPGHHVLLPLERARAEATDRTVVVPGMTSDRFESLPSWAGDPTSLGPDYESRLREEYDRALGGGRERDRRGGTGQRLVRLSDLEDHRVSKNSRDVRKWNVLGGDGAKIGQVAELLVDQGELEVRYLDCRVEEDTLGLERVDRHVLLPVEHVRLDADDKQVVVDGLFAADLADYPVYTGLPLRDDVRSGVDRFFRAADRSDDAEPGAPGASPRFFGRARRPRRGARTPVAQGAGEAAATGDEAGRSDERRLVVEGASDDEAVLRKGDQRVRIRITGDDIVIDKGRETDDG